MRRTSSFLIVGLLLVLGGGAWAALGLLTAGPKPDGTGVTPEGWRIAPAGKQTPLGPGPLAVATTPDGALVLVENAGYSDHALQVVDARSGDVAQTFPAAADGSTGYYVGLVVASDGTRAYASDGQASGIHTFTIAGKSVSEGPELALPAGTWPAGIALSRDGRRLFVAGNLTDNLLMLDAAGAITATIPVGHLPYGVALSRDERRAFVTNWGGSTVTVVDAADGRVRATLAVGTHPSAIAANPTNDEIYVADTDSDGVSVIDGRTSRVVRTIDLRPFPGAPTGASPNALAVTRDGGTLYVAEAGSNAVAVVRLAGHGGWSFDRVAGLIPTAWYPSGVALGPDDATLFVANMKGLGIGPVAPDQYIGAMLRGTLSRIAVPDERRLAEYTRQVAENVKLPDEGLPPGGVGAGNPIPDRVGGRSPIKHVIYVLKENRTYDQVFGDLGRGNGDPTLAIFGEKVTPNHHELARRFVTFDNFYCDGEVSADGWTWSNAANANTYNQKNWPLDYGVAGRLYDFGGFGDPETAALPGADTARPFLWDSLAARHIAYRNYGFFVNTAPVEIDSSMPGLVGHTDLAYDGWGMDVPDQVRVDEWLQEFGPRVAAGRLPPMQFVYLPRDHTVGTFPGGLTPSAMVADNDLALGRLVEAVSHSRFWASTAIFVVEDDAQDGPDHVDGHRTVALAISPYTQVGKVDSTFYSTVSMLRTMELIVGIDPLSQFDALATPMRRAFASAPNTASYAARTPAQSLTEVTPDDAPLAQASKHLDFSRPDAANPRVLNEAIWKSVRGAGSPMPGWRFSLRRRLARAGR
jgi:YVTN family beta-propeller protein